MRVSVHWLRITLLIPLLFGLCLGACSCGEKPAVEDCEKTGCLDDQVCVNGKCEKKSGEGACKELKDCKNGQTCKDLKCVDCEADTDCGTDKICEKKVCKDAVCTKKKACKNGQVCEEGRCGSCKADTDCGEDKTCDKGVCKDVECSDKKPCTGGEICIDGKCSSCVADKDCGTDKICEKDVCIKSECNDKNPCEKGRLCQKSRCIDCTDDGECGKAKVCMKGLCSEGCRDNQDCENGQKCEANSNTCVECLKSDDCSDGKVCRGNVCKACRVDKGCGSDKLCEQGKCIEGNCRKNQDCNNAGEICKSNKCAKCSADADCAKGQICSTDKCRIGCRKSTDCQKKQVCELKSLLCKGCILNSDCQAGAVCIGDTCVKCTGDKDCDEKGKSSGKLCLNSVCVTANCRANGDCKDAKVCRKNLCESCLSDKECGSEQLCVTGRCKKGNCRTNDDCIKQGKQGQVCLKNICSKCSKDADCGTGKFCLKDLCKVADCRKSSECKSGQVCNNNRCEKCSADSDCGTGQICSAGACKVGNCKKTSNCTGGQVCKKNQCVKCAGDTECGSGRLCVLGACTSGNCKKMSDCPNGQICQSNRCVRCLKDSECGSGKLCVSGACTSGNCKKTSDCSAGQICRNNKCGKCGVDSDCDKGQLCLAGACKVANCRKISDCTNGQVCKNNTCMKCSKDSECGSGKLCLAGACKVANCRKVSDCSGGQICLNNTCTKCSKDSECGSGKLCLAGACKVANCHKSSDCSGGQICKSNQCRKCLKDSECTTGQLCLSGSCKKANCHKISDCKNYLACVKNSCTQCTKDSNCGAGYLCRSSQCLIQVLSSSGGLKWSNGTYGKNCTHYRYPASGYAASKKDGVYWIKPQSTKPAFKVVCDMTTDGGGWTMIAKYQSNLELFKYNSAKHQQQTSANGKDLSTPPDLNNASVFGHVNHTWFDVKSRDLKLRCRKSPTASWYSHTRSELFTNWNSGDKGTYGNGKGWGFLGRIGKHGRSSHFSCGKNRNLNDYVGISYCRGTGRSGSWHNHLVSFSFNRSKSAYTGGLSIGCKGTGINTGKSAKWQGEVWIRDQSSRTAMTYNGAFRWGNGTYAKNCTDYRYPAVDYLPATHSGLYWIKPSTKAAFKAYCDMKTDGGGWTRFWWFTAKQSMASVKDVLGQNLRDCDPTKPTCYAIIPWTTPTHLMTTADDKAFQIYAFNKSSSTSNRALASFTKRAEWKQGRGAGAAWPPVRAVGTSVYRSKEGGAQARYWWYGLMKGIKSFNLDNDSAWCHTFFSAGYDYRSGNVGKRGVDHTDNGCAFHNSEQKSLFLYAKGSVNPMRKVMSYQGAFRWGDGTYAKNCTHYRFPTSAYSAATQNGLYWIKPSTKAAFEVYCDMKTDGGGWTRFWWFAAKQSMARIKDVLGQNLRDCDPTKPVCHAIVPWATPSHLMTTANNKAFQIYAFNKGNSTSNRVLASLTKRTEWKLGRGKGAAWPPAKAIGTSVYRSREGGAQAGYWWYGLMNGIKSFNLDNDSGWCYTFFSAGYDHRGSGGKRGVDHTDNGCASQNSEQKSLFLYVRDHLQ